jgi:hypothetical protein
MRSFSPILLLALLGVIASSANAKDGTTRNTRRRATATTAAAAHDADSDLLENIIDQVSRDLVGEESASAPATVPDGYHADPAPESDRMEIEEWDRVLWFSSSYSTSSSKGKYKSGKKGSKKGGHRGSKKGGHKGSKKGGHKGSKKGGHRGSKKGGHKGRKKGGHKGSKGSKGYSKSAKGHWGGGGRSSKGGHKYEVRSEKHESRSRQYNVKDKYDYRKE